MPHQKLVTKLFYIRNDTRAEKLGVGFAQLKKVEDSFQRDSLFVLHLVHQLVGFAFVD